MHRVLLVAMLATVSLLPLVGSPQTAAQAGTPEACLVTTEEENVAIAKVWHEAVINNRNPGALHDILAPAVVHHAAGAYPDEMDLAGVTTMMGDFLQAFPDLRYTFDFFVVQDDMVVERYTATGTQEGALGALPASGRTATWTGINIFRIECGKIAEVWSEVGAIGRARQLTTEATPAP